MTEYNLIILPGWGGNHETWHGFVKVISPEFKSVHVIDLPCFGAVPCPDKAWGVEDYADFVYKKITKLNLPNVVLFGHSFGGQVAVKFLHEHPELAVRLILSGPAALRPSFSFRRFFYGLLAKFGKKLFSLPFAEKASSFAKKLLYVKLIGSRDYLESAGIKREIFKKIIRQDLRHLLPKIQIKTLIIWGKKDRFVPVKNGKKMQELMPNACLHVIKSGGHGLHIYKIKEMHEIIQNFLEHDKC